MITFVLFFTLASMAIAEENVSNSIGSKDEDAMKMIAFARSACKPGSPANQIMKRSYECEKKVYTDDQKKILAECFKQRTGVDRPSTIKEELVIQCKEENMSDEKLKQEIEERCEQDKFGPEVYNKTSDAIEVSL